MKEIMFLKFPDKVVFGILLVLPAVVGTAVSTCGIFFTYALIVLRAHRPAWALAQPAI